MWRHFRRQTQSEFYTFSDLCRVSVRLIRHVVNPAEFIHSFCGAFTRARFILARIDITTARTLFATKWWESIVYNCTLGYSNYRVWLRFVSRLSIDAHPPSLYPLADSSTIAVALPNSWYLCCASITLKINYHWTHKWVISLVELHLHGHLVPNG